MARCSSPADLHFAGLWLCHRHHQRVLLAARMAVEIEHEQRYGPREWQADAPAVIYYMRRASDGLIKIGRTGDFRRRMAELRAEHGVMQILLTHPGGKAEESAMHRKFISLWAEGEFFRPRKPLINWIIKIRQQQPRETLLPGTLPMADLEALAARPNGKERVNCYENVSDAQAD